MIILVRQQCRDSTGGHLSVRRLDRKELGTDHSLRGSPFARVDVSRAAADDCLIRPYTALERQYVRPGAGEDKEGLRRGTELLPDQRFSFNGVLVATVCRYRTMIGAHNGVHHIGMRGSPVVAREIGKGKREWIGLLHGVKCGWFGDDRQARRL